MTERAIWRLIVRTTILILLLGLGLWFAWTVRGVLVLLLVAVVLATGLSPILDAIAGRAPQRRVLRVQRPVAMLILYLAFIALVVLGGFLLIPRLIGQLDELAHEAPAYVTGVRQALDALAADYPFLQGISEQLSAQVSGSLVGLGDVSSQASQVLRFALGVANTLLSFLLLLVITFYLIVDGENILRGVLRLLPPENRPLANTVAARAGDKIGAWMVGQLLLSVIIGGATLLGLLALGVPYALLLAVVAAIGELIPMVGPILAAVPAIVIAALQSPFLALLTVVLYIIIQQLENHIVVPQVMRHAVDLPPVLVIAALLMGNEVLGIVGAILALPIAASLSALLGELLALREGKGAPPK